MGYLVRPSSRSPLCTAGPFGGGVSFRFGLACNPLQKRKKLVFKLLLNGFFSDWCQHVRQSKG